MPESRLTKRKKKGKLKGCWQKRRRATVLFCDYFICKKGFRILERGVRSFAGDNGTEPSYPQRPRGGSRPQKLPAGRARVIHGEVNKTETE